MFVLSHLVEWLEDLLQFIGSNADTIVLDGNGEISYLRILIFIQFGRQEESKFGIGLDVSSTDTVPPSGTFLKALERKLK